MTQEKFKPNIEKIQQTSLKFQEVFKRMDAEILVLDNIIAQLDEQIHVSPLAEYRLNKAKRLLKMDSSISEES